jgi:hypothetical protein
MFDDADVEVRIASIPTAAHLVCMGHEPLGIRATNGGAVIRFSAAAQVAVDEFVRAKRMIDQAVDRFVNGQRSERRSDA